MKRVIIMLSVLAAVAGCTKWIKPDSEEDTLSKHFKHTGCSPDTRGLFTDDPSLLTLKYENGDLRVTRTNAELNCSFKDLGLTCEAYLEGNTIHYNVVCERAGYGEANCVCLVEKMTSAVTGLERGKEYIFQYSALGFGLKPITFTFDRNLHQIYDVESMYNYVTE